MTDSSPLNISPIKVSIAIPSNRDHPTYFVCSLVGMFQHLTMIRDKSPVKEVHLHMKSGVSNLAGARNDLVKEAITSGMTHLLFIDDDMTFPFDLLDKLMAAMLEHNAPVMAANCCLKDPRALIYTALDFDKSRIASKGKVGVQRVLRVGTGVMLIDLSIFKNIPAPWFEMLWDEQKQRVAGEDYYFCDLLSRNNIPIHIDHFISNHIGHIGKFIYDFDCYPDTPTNVIEESEPAALSDVRASA